MEINPRPGHRSEREQRQSWQGYRGRVCGGRQSGKVRYDGRGYVERFTLGDDPVAIARRLLRAKWDKHGAFYDDIRYPRRSFH
jgi:hypothetical protein